MTTLVASYTPGANRSNFTGYQGVRFTVTGSNITVNTLGIRVATGNIANKNVYILNNANTVLASATINITGVVPVGTFVYASISPITLTVGTVYNLVCQTTSGGENWSDTGAVTLNGAGTVFSIWSASLGSFTQQVSGQMYIGVDLNGTPPTPQDQLPVWRQWPQQRYPNAYDDPQLNIDENDNRISLPWLRRNQVTTWKITNAAVNVSKFVQYDALAQPDTAVSIAKFASYNVIETIPPIPSNVYNIRRQMLVAWDEIEQEEALNSFHLIHSRKQTASTSINATITLSSASATGGVGSLSISLPTGLTGVSATFALSSPARTIAYTLPSIIGTFGQGTLNANYGGAATLSSVAASFLQGTLSETISRTLPSVTMSGVVVVPHVVFPVFPVGVHGTFALGVTTSVVSTLKTLTGISGTFHVSTAFEPKITVTLHGVYGLLTHGYPSANQHWFRELSPVIATSHLGRFSENIPVFLHGVYATSQLGVLNNHFFRTLVGVRMVAHLGSLRPVVVGDGLLMRNFAVVSNIEPVQSTLSMQWSDSNGKSFGNAIEQTFGNPGQYFTSIKYNRLGMGRSRCFLLHWSAPIKTSLTGVFLETTEGGT